MSLSKFRIRFILAGSKTIHQEIIYARNLIAALADLKHEHGPVTISSVEDLTGDANEAP